MMAAMGEPATNAVSTLVCSPRWDTTAATLWSALRDEAPPGLSCDTFERALGRAVAAAEAGDVAGVLTLEPAFEDLARLVRSLDGSVDKDS